MSEEMQLSLSHGSSVSATYLPLPSHQLSSWLQLRSALPNAKRLLSPQDSGYVYLLACSWLEELEKAVTQACQEGRKLVISKGNTELLQEESALEIQGCPELRTILKPGLEHQIDFICVHDSFWQKLAFLQLVQVRKKVSQGRIQLYYPVLSVLATSQSNLSMFEFNRGHLIQTILQFQGDCKELYERLEETVKRSSLFGEMQWEREHQFIQIFMLDHRIKKEKWVSIIRSQCEKSYQLTYLIPLRATLLKRECIPLPKGSIILLEVLEKQLYCFYEKDSTPKSKCKHCQSIDFHSFKCSCLKYRYCNQDCFNKDSVHKYYCGVKSTQASSAKPQLVRRNDFQGIPNIGNSCYMAAGLQCLFRLQAFRQEVLQLMLKEDDQISNSLVQIFRGLLAKQDFPGLLNFKIAFQKVFSSFKGYQQQDAQEFVSLLLDHLHQNYKNASNESLVSKLFQGWSENRISCECGGSRSVRERFLMLSVPVPDLSFCNVELVRSDIQISNTRFYYQKGCPPLLADILANISLKYGFSDPVAYFSNMERAHLVNPLLSGDSVVVRERLPFETQLACLVSLRMTRCGSSFGNELFHRTFSKARGIFTSLQHSIENFKTKLLLAFPNLLAGLSFQLLNEIDVNLPVSSHKSLLKLESRMELFIKGELPTIKQVDVAAGSLQLDLSRSLQSMFAQQKLEKGSLDCEVCKESRQARTKISLVKLPPFLIVHLKRFTQNQRKNGLLLHYEPDLIDFSPFYEGTSNYSLQGICNHQGGLSYGHYTAIERIGDQWIQFNDADIYEVGSRKVVSGQNYLLFLKKIL